MLKKLAVTAVLVAMSLPGYANDDIAKVERLGAQAYAALVCWPDDSTADVNRQHNAHFKRRVDEIIAITDRVPEEQRKIMFGKLYPGLHSLYYFQDESGDFRKGYALASMAEMLKALRVKGPNQNPRSTFDQAICSVFDVNS